MSDDHPHDSQSRSELEGRCEAARQELGALRRRMDTIKQEVADEVDRQWASPWRSDEVFDLKVTARLSSHEEYRSLLGQTRDIQRMEAELGEALGRTGEDESA